MWCDFYFHININQITRTFLLTYFKIFSVYSYIYIREMGGSVGSAPACYSSFLGSNQKYKMGEISKSVANTLQPAKNKQKMFI
jgi:hypothetical protein